MSELDEHIRFMDLFMKHNPDATIKDYFAVTDGILSKNENKRKFLWEDIEETINKIDKCFK